VHGAVALVLVHAERLHRRHAQPCSTRNPPAGAPRQQSYSLCGKRDVDLCIVAVQITWG